jgi:hypothetical protein
VSRFWTRYGAFALILLQAGLLAWYLAAGWGRGGPGFPFDDGWIHAVFARNLAHTGAVGFQPGEWTGGTTSLLWVVLLAVGQKLGLSAPWAAALWGAGAWSAAGVCFFLLLRDGLPSRRAALVWSLLLAALGPFTYLALSGMETALFLALSLAAIAAFSRERYGLAGGALALLVVTRVEGLAVVGLLGLALVLKRRRWPVAAAVLLPPLVMLLLYGLYNWLVTGTPLPTTMAGRKWLWGFPDRLVVLTPRALGNYVRIWRGYLEGWLFHVNALPGLLQDAYRLLIWGSLGLGLVVLLKRTLDWIRGRASPALPLLFGWVLIHNLVYLLLAPFPSIRHQVPNLLLLVLLLGAAWHSADAWLAARRTGLRLVPAALALLLAFGLLPSAVDWQRAYADHVWQINQVHVQAGRWIDAHVPPAATVAAFDIGAVAYFGQRQTLDLGGLVDADFTQRYLYPGRVPDYLRERRVDYLAMVETGGPTNSLSDKLGLAGAAAAGLRFEAKAGFQITPTTPAPFDSLPFYFYLPAYWQMTIYQVEREQP